MRTKLSMKKKTAATITAGVLVAGTAAGAYAYWTTTGTGTGSATTGTNTAVTVAQVGTITGLVPGGTAQAVDFKINNPATTNNYVTTVTVSISGITAPNATTSNDCTTADFAIVQPTAINSDLTPGLHNYSPSGATLQLVNNPSKNQDGCKGASVALTFTAA